MRRVLRGRAVRWVRRAVLLAALLALLVRPGDRDAVVVGERPELDVLVVLDRTTSMSALDDPSGSRLAAAQADLVALAGRLGPARFTVVTVGRDPELVLPATTDLAAFQDVVDQVTVEAPEVGSGSSIGRAVPLARQLMKNVQGGRPRVLVYAGDGEDTGPVEASSWGSVQPLVAAAVMLGYGTSSGGVMPLETGGASGTGGKLTFVPDLTGKPAVSRADPAALELAADQLGGIHVQGVGLLGLQQVVDVVRESAYDDLAPGVPARQLAWVWALLLLACALPELRSAWSAWLEVRREPET